MSTKENVLKLLEENNDYISGESIAERLGISRNAIWKAINELRKDGYSIDAVRNRGYLLASDNDIISKAGIMANVDSATAGAITEIHVYDTLVSTNRTAKELAIAGAKNGTVIIANSQTVGKGRKDHSFYSPYGGIYMSIIMTPEHLPYIENDAITTFIGNAVCSAIANLTDINPRLKPINDLYIGDKKICGILTEAGTEFETGDLQWIVVGIGINFAVDISAFPDDIKNKVTTLFPAGDAPISRNQLIAKILTQIL